MATTTIFSNRIRKEFLDINTITELQNMINIVNEAKIKAYSVIAYDKLIQVEKIHKSLHLYIKNTFNLNTYYSNFAVTEGKWVNSSNKELQKLYINDTKENIKHRKEIIKKHEKKLAYWTKIKNYMILVSKYIKLGKKVKLKNFSPYSFFIENNEILVDANYIKKELIYSFYLFEVKVVNKKLSTLKNKIYLLKHGLQNKENKLYKLENKTIKSCFGTKKLFKEQFSIYEGKYNLWKDKFNCQRHKAIQLQGCRTATQGNFCIRYDEELKTMKIMLPMQKEVELGSKYAKADYIEIPNVDFSYNKSTYLEALNTKGSPISYRIEDYGHYYLIKATVEFFNDEEHLNYSKEDGVIGYDINVDYIAYSETDKYGNLISFGNIPFNIEYKTAGQSNKIIEKVAIQIVDIANSKNKPLVGEDIKYINNNKMTYGSKKRNKKITLFAYRKLITSIESRAYKKNIDVTYINPAYTSSTGKLKYMKAKGISIHTSASYCIGRRGMGFKESLKQYSKYNINWSKLNREFKTIWTQWLYKTPEMSRYKELKEYVNEIKEINKDKTIIVKPIIYVR